MANHRIPVTREMILEASTKITHDMTSDDFARVLGVTPSLLGRRFEEMGTTWKKLRLNSTAPCKNGHPASERAFLGNRMRCMACQRVHDQNPLKKAKRSHQGKNPKPRRRTLIAPLWTYDDYIRVTDQEFATPHWLRQGPKILEWLNRMKEKEARNEQQSER